MYEEIKYTTGNLYKAVPRFGEFCSCCCLPLLPQLAGSILATWERPYRDSLYMCRLQNFRSIHGAWYTLFCPTWYNSLFLQSATSNEQPRGNEEAPLHRGQIWREAARASADATTAIFYIDLELVSFSSSSLSPCSPSSRISPRQSRNPRSLKWFRGPPPSQEPQIEANT